MQEKISDLSNSLRDFDLTTCLKRYINLISNTLFIIYYISNRQCCIKISKLLLRLFHLFNERQNISNDNSNKIDSNLIEKSIQLADIVPEHKIIEMVKILKAKYMFNVLRLNQKL